MNVFHDPRPLRRVIDWTERGPIVRLFRYAACAATPQTGYLWKKDHQHFAHWFLPFVASAGYKPERQN